MGAQRRTILRRGRLGPATFVLFALLLVFPVSAVVRLPAGSHGRLLLAASFVFSGITFLLYREDKLRAEAGEWRIAESSLHGLELVGGWPGAFLAQRWFRHKNAKASYQVVFWIIVLLHQAASVDSLLAWRFGKQLWGLIQAVPA